MWRKWWWFSCSRASLLYKCEDEDMALAKNNRDNLIKFFSGQILLMDSMSSVRNAYAMLRQIER